MKLGTLPGVLASMCRGAWNSFCAPHADRRPALIATLAIGWLAILALEGPWKWIVFLACAGFMLRVLMETKNETD